MFRDLLATVSVLMLALVTSISGCADRLADRAPQSDDAPESGRAAVVPAPNAETTQAPAWNPAAVRSRRILQGDFAMSAVEAATMAYHHRYQRFPAQAEDILHAGWLLFAPVNSDGTPASAVAIDSGKTEPPAGTWGINVSDGWQRIRLGATGDSPKSHGVSSQLRTQAESGLSVQADLDAVRYENFRSTIVGMLVEYSRVHGVLPDRWETVQEFMQFAPLSHLADTAEHVAVLDLALDRPNATWWLILNWPGHTNPWFMSVACEFNHADSTLRASTKPESALPAGLEPFATFRFPLMEAPRPSKAPVNTKPVDVQTGGKVSRN